MLQLLHLRFICVCPWMHIPNHIFTNFIIPATAAQPNTASQVLYPLHEKLHHPETPSEMAFVAAYQVLPRSNHHVHSHATFSCNSTRPISGSGSMTSPRIARISMRPGLCTTPCSGVSLARCPCCPRCRWTVCRPCCTRRAACRLWCPAPIRPAAATSPSTASLLRFECCCSSFLIFDRSFCSKASLLI